MIILQNVEEKSCAAVQKRKINVMSKYLVHMWCVSHSHKTTDEIIIIDNRTRITSLTHTRTRTWTRTFTLTNEMCNIKQFVNEHSCQFDSHVKTSNLIWIYDTYRNKKETLSRRKTTTLNWWMHIMLNCCCCCFFSSWNFLWSPISNHMRVARLHTFTFFAHLRAHKSMSCGSNMCACICVFQTKMIVFVRQTSKKKVTIKKSLWKFTEKPTATTTNEIYGSKNCTARTWTSTWIILFTFECKNKCLYFFLSFVRCILNFAQ